MRYIKLIPALIRWVIFGRDIDQLIMILLGEKPVTVTIETTKTGRFAIVNRYGDTLKDYARSRDARRGATRLGYSVA